MKEVTLAKRRTLVLLFAFTVAASVFCGMLASSASMPRQEAPLLLYSSQLKDDIKKVFLKAIYDAKHSIFLCIYGLTDDDIIEALQAKDREGCIVEVFYDKKGSAGIEKKLPSHCLYLVKTAGLMHKKILCIDEDLSFIGSANLTETSLRLHDNLVIGFYDRGLSEHLKTSIAPQYTFHPQGRKVHYFSLPDPEKQALAAILSHIEEAKKSIRICMFTFTNKKIIAALIAAKERGVDVEVALDSYSAAGASKKGAEQLKKGGISLYVTPRGKLLHHKSCIIDNEIFITGSTNWTEAAFNKNDDCLLIFEGLKAQDAKKILQLWTTLKKEPFQP